ncbi:MAG: hypothetical protein PHH08_04705 [Candidatus ainarchaeum sp.]|nr:hypothetical protein [Candidatus ainarchaeum sp.]
MPPARRKRALNPAQRTARARPMQFSRREVILASKIIRQQRHREQRQFRAVEARANARQFPKYLPHQRKAALAEIGENLQAQMRVLRGYAASAQEALRKIGKAGQDMNMVWYASELSARLGIPKERLAESIMRNGLKNTYKALKEIHEIGLELEIDAEETKRRINQRGIMPVYAEMAEQYEQAKQMGMVA